MTPERWYCTSCGHQVVTVRRTIDSRYPIGECVPCGQYRVCIADQELALRMVDEAKRQQRARLHAVHVRDGTRPRTCAACRALVAAKEGLAL